MTECPPTLPQSPPLIPRYLSKQRNLTIFFRKFSIGYPIEIKCVSSIEPLPWASAGEIKSEGTSHDVHENKYRKNVAPTLSHDLDENTGGYSFYPTMFMKRNEVSASAGEKIVPSKTT